VQLEQKLVFDCLAGNLTELAAQHYRGRMMVCDEVQELSLGSIQRFYGAPA